MRLSVPGGFTWADVGSLPSLADTHSMDADGNCVIGDPVVQDAKNCIVVNDAGADSMAVAVRGVEGLAVIVTDDGVLVIPRDRTQEIRDIVQELKERGADQV